MAQKITYSCDYCGAVKGEQNHWFIVAPSATPVTDAARIVIEKWDPQIQGKHACGERCVAKAVSEFCGGGGK